MKKIPVVDSALREKGIFVDQIISKELERQLNAGSIKNAGNEQIRIYKVSGSGTKGQIVLLRKTGSDWLATLATFSITYNENFDSIGILVQEVKERKPASGWTILTDSLTNLGIFRLPGRESLNNYDVPSDPELVKFEYYVDNSYGVYEYSSPDINQNEFSEVKKIVSIMDFLENEFGFKGFGFK